MGKPLALRSILPQTPHNPVYVCGGALGPGSRSRCRPGALAALSRDAVRPGAGRQGEGSLDKGGGVQPTGSMWLLQRRYSGAPVTAQVGPAAVVAARGTCCARSGSPPPSLASPWRNSCTSTRPSLLLSSSSNRRPQRCRRSASLEPPRMAPARGGGEAPQRRPRRGLSGSPSPPGSPKGQLPGPPAQQPLRCGAKLLHLLEVINASRPRPRQNLRLLLPQPPE